MNARLRQIGREKILERIAAMENNEHVPDDILTSILTSFSKFKTIYKQAILILISLKFVPIKKRGRKFGH